MTDAIQPELPTVADRGDQRCVALLYHHVGQARTGSYSDLTVSPLEFERQIQWIVRHGYTGIRPAEWLARCKSGAKLPRKPILITFDDAYADLTEHALPILRHFGLCATIFVVSALIGQSSVWDEGLGYSTLPLMSAEQIRYWASQGIEFGSHSRTHPDLTNLSGETLLDEIVTSRDELAELLQRPVTSFAYPFGAINNAVHGVVQSSFDLGFSAVHGLNCCQTDPHLLRRVVVNPNQSLWEFSLMVRLGDHWRSKLALRTRLKRLLVMGRSALLKQR